MLIHLVISAVVLCRVVWTPRRTKLAFQQIANALPHKVGRRLLLLAYGSAALYELLFFVSNLSLSTGANRVTFEQLENGANGTEM